MDKITQLYSTTPEELTKIILEGVKSQINDLKADFKEKHNEELMTRQETADLLKISLPCLHDWVNKGILTAYKIGNRTYFRREDIIKTLMSSNLK